MFLTTCAVCAKALDDEVFGRGPVKAAAHQVVDLAFVDRRAGGSVRSSHVVS